MHCRSCELLIESELLKVRELKRLSWGHSRGTAIQYTRNLTRKWLIRSFARPAMKLASIRLIFSRNPKDYIDLGVSLFIVLDLFFMANILG